MNDDQKPKSLRLIKKFTASQVAERMSYWMVRSPQELTDSATDQTLSVLDHICIGCLLSDMRYGKLKNTDVMLSRIIGTPVNMMNVKSAVKHEDGVNIQFIGVDVKDENSLQALKDLRHDDAAAEDN